MKDKSKFNKIRQIKNKLNLIEEIGGECEFCGTKDFRKMCFHHKDEFEKEFEIGDKSKLSYGVLLKEVKKCQLLCQNCHRELHYELDKVEDRRDDKKIYLEYAGGECVKCGYDKCPAALTFHHRNPEEKEFWIGGLSERINSIYELSERIKNEIEKCDLLCANCHVLEHFDDNFYLDNKNIIDNYEVRKISRKIDRSKVFDLHNKGYKNKDIAEVMNCGRSTISGILKK